MAARQSDGEAQKLRFGPWLLDAVSSGIYRGLCWTGPERGAFRVPWKHIARRDVTSSDVEIFKAWAKASGRYSGSPEDATKWKTNFRCALRSTQMFELLEDNSKCSDDPHKVFRVTQAALRHSEEGDFSSPDHGLDQQLLHQQPQLELSPQGVASEIAPPGSANPSCASTLEDLEMLLLVLQQCGISPSNVEPHDPSWAPGGDTPNQDPLLQHHPDPSQSCLPPLVFPQWVPEQPPMGAYSPPDPMLVGQTGGCSGAGAALEVPVVPVQPPEEILLLAPAPSPGPPPEDVSDGIDPTLEINIYYRGKLQREEVVGSSCCLLAFQPFDPTLALRPGQLVEFPSPLSLSDNKQRQFTEQLLAGVGLQLEKRGHKLFATRLKKSRVFWALSKQLEGSEEPPTNLLCRNQETLIFDFKEFCTELRDFRNRKRQHSPDFTIYLCFGQCFSRAKPKESKLVLVQVVPRFCKVWHEQVLREGASSLNSATISLQLSDSFSLYELIEQYTMQID